MALTVNEEGFLLDWQAWDEATAVALAAQHEVVLTPAHWEILYFLRRYYVECQRLPNMRGFSHALRLHFGPEKASSLYLHRLFPESPLKFACKFAGLPKPPTCL